MALASRRITKQGQRSMTEQIVSQDITQIQDIITPQITKQRYITEEKYKLKFPQLRLTPKFTKKIIRKKKKLVNLFQYQPNLPAIAFNVRKMFKNIPKVATGFEKFRPIPIERMR